VVDGIEYLFPFGQEPPPAEGWHTPQVFLLQAYDEFGVGYSESKFLAADRDLPAGASGERPVFNMLLVIDGRVAGRWRRTVSSGGVKVQVGLHRPLSSAESAALATAARLHGEFLGRDAELEVEAL
jgi:hypothetical protein